MNHEISAVQKLINTAIEFLVTYSFQVVGALIILAIGFLIANWIGKFLFTFFQKKNLDITLSKFITGVVRIIVLAFAFLIALGGFGVTIAPFVAALGALTFGASIAIQGPLSNYGAGISIILSRPFVVGDTITVNHVSGVVKEVKLAATLLFSEEEGTWITVPNKEIVGQILHNSKAVRLAEGQVGISYDNDPEAATKIICETLSKFEAVAKEPKPQVGIKEFADSSINLEFRYRAPSVCYYQTVYRVNLEVFKALTASGFTIPYPQREVRLISQPQGTP